MLQVKRLENVFGIKKWENPSHLEFKTINVLYASNGTAKSSFADGIAAIAAGEQPQGSFPGDPLPRFELVVDGKTINKRNLSPFPCLLFQGAKEYPLRPEVSQRYLLTESKKNRADCLLSLLANVIDDTSRTLNKYWPLARMNKAERMCSAMYPNPDKDPILAFLLETDFSEEPFPFSLTAQEVDILVSAQTYDIASSGIDPRLIRAYERALRKARRDAFLDTGFTVDDFEAFLNSAKDSGYFSPKRRLKLGGRVVDAAEAQIILNQKKTKIFSNPKVAAARSKILKAFSKKASAELRVLFNKHPDLLAYLSKPKRLMTKAIVTAFSSDLQTLITKKSEAADAYRKLSFIFDSKNYSIGEYQKVWEEFRSRFCVTAYDIEIVEEQEKLTGFRIPALQRTYSGTKVAIPGDNRLSDGERKTFHLINLVLQIELLLKSRDKESFHIIFDDAVDSFDYRNKFAFLQYFADLAPRVKNGQIFILTHSFDFYRSLIFALKSTKKNPWYSFDDSIGRYLLVKQRDCNLSLSDSTGLENYFSLTELGEWAKSQDHAKFFAFIAIARGMVELQGESEDPFVPYLHFMGDETDFAEIKHHPLIAGSGCCFADDANYQNELISLCDSFVVSPPNDIELEKKVCLALAIRHLRERFLLGTGHDLGLKLSKDKKRMNVVNDMEGKVLRRVSDPSIEKAIIGAKVISNQNVHLNDFSFEPIVDIGVELLIESYQALRKLNLQWAFGTISKECVVRPTSN